MIRKILFGILILSIVIIGTGLRIASAVFDRPIIYYILYALIFIAVIMGLVYLCKKYHSAIASLLHLYIEDWKQRLKETWNSFLKWFRPNLPNKKDVQFHSLAPTDNAIKTEIYEEALTQALLNKNIYNIAVTGAYGSGKSSFLRTYFKKYPNLWPLGGKKNKVITVSLANLANIVKKPKHHADVNQEVELSILHQLFFHERATSLIDSHFTKIQKYGIGKMCLLTCCVLLYLVSCIHLKWPRLMTRMAELQRLNIAEYRDWWHWISVIIAIIGTAIIVYKLIRVISQIAVRSLSLKTASIEIDKGDKSILNAHIDEIIYFFSVTGYNVVLIEDLDRLKQQGIFVKLREINHLINNSEEVKQRVRFIYALKDDMFKDETRTKFFDFIIPIIPLVDKSNAGDMLHTLVPQNLGNVVDAVAVYLHDARILSNIVNEFHVYKEQFKGKDEDDQIFALVVYKNLFPDDFENLRTHKSGKLADELRKRDTLVKEMTQQIKADIEKEQNEIAKCRKEMMKDKTELRQLLAAVIMKEAMGRTTFTNVYDCVNINGNIISVEDLAEENNFQQFITADVYNIVSTHRNMATPIRNTVESALKSAYGEEGYQHRLALVEGKANLPEREAHLQELIDEESRLQKMTIQKLLQEQKTKQQEGEDDERTTQERFIYDMLYGGYITSNYSAYISCIHEGRLSGNDYTFIRSVRVKEPLKDQNFELHNVRGIIEKLELGNFSQKEILNVDLMDVLFGSKRYEAKQDEVIELLKTYSLECIAFIALYVQIGLYVELLIQKLCADRKNLLGEAIEKSNLPTDSKLNVLISIIAYANEEDAVANVQHQKERIAKMSDFFLWAISAERLKYVAKELDLHFEAIDEGVKKEFIDFVRDNNLYAITPEMLRRIIPMEEVGDEFFYAHNFTCIASKYPVICQYVEENVKVYVENVTLALPDNNWEQPEYLARLLRNKELSDELREQIILYEDSTWRDINEGGEIDPQIAVLLYKHMRIQVTWENVLILFALDRDVFVEYMKNEKVVAALQEQGDSAFKEGNREKWVELQNAIVSEESLGETSKALVDCFDIAFEKTVLEHCELELLKSLIKKGKVARGAEEYNLIHEEDRELSFSFFVNHYDNYATEISEMTFDEYDFEYVFDAKYGLSVDQKLHIITNVDYGECISKYTVGDVIDLFMLPEILPDDISDEAKEVVKYVLCYAEADSLAKIRLSLKFPLESTDEAEHMVRALDSTYTDGHRLHHRIPYSPEAYDFCGMLKDLQYIRNYRWYRDIQQISIGEF